MPPQTEGQSDLFLSRRNQSHALNDENDYDNDYDGGDSSGQESSSSASLSLSSADSDVLIMRARTFPEWHELPALQAHIQTSLVDAVQSLRTPRTPRGAGGNASSGGYNGSYLSPRFAHSPRYSIEAPLSPTSLLSPLSPLGVEKAARGTSGGNTENNRNDGNNGDDGTGRTRRASPVERETTRLLLLALNFLVAFFLSGLRTVLLEVQEMVVMVNVRMGRARRKKKKLRNIDGGGGGGGVGEQQAL